MRGPFVQLLALSVSRGGAVRVHPTFFVAGADLSLTVIPQTVSLEVLDPRRWSFHDCALDGTFAAGLVQSLEQASPLSFVTPIPSDDAVERAFASFASRSVHWGECLFAAFFMLACNRPGAAPLLRQAQDRFARLGTKVIGDPPEWRLVLGARLAELHRRLQDPDGAQQCRTDADNQSAALRLPPIRWDAV